MAKAEELRIRPYARLLTMLGDQLIKNERIAIIELIKNSYDADADWVKVTFSDFLDDFRIGENSKIIIEDSRHGMTTDVIKNHWMNPATPEKKLRKAKMNLTDKGRVIQGEKGIGRFATLKLGRNIRLITRAKNDEYEQVVDFDFSKYDDEFLSENGKEKTLFLDDLSIEFFIREPDVFSPKTLVLGTRKITSPPHGTRIEISDLKGSWSDKKIGAVYRDLTRLESIFSHGNEKTDLPNKADFTVWIYRDSEHLEYQAEYIEKL